MSKNLAIKYFLANMKSVHQNMDLTMQGVTNEVAHFQPPHKANPIAGVYAHLLFSEDFFIQFFLKQTKPLFESEWKNKTGISELQPTEWEKAYPKWLKTVTLDIEKTKPYAQAVYTSSEIYLAGLKDEDLEKAIDMSMFGMGSKPQGEFLSGMVIGHAWSIMGEIAVLKGIQNLKGYPF